jgi:hypothetical protein
MEILPINNTKTVDHLNKCIKSGKDVFVLIYMEGCGPCNLVRPEWTKLEKILESKAGNKYNNVIIANVESDNLDKIQLNKVPEGFPSIKYISNKGTLEEDFKNERNVNAIMSWINKNISKKGHGNPSKKNKRINNRTTKNRFSKSRRRTNRVRK